MTELDRPIRRRTRMPRLQFRIGGLMLAVAAVALACWATTRGPTPLIWALFVLGPSIGAIYACRRSSGGIRAIVTGVLIGATLQALVGATLAAIYGDRRLGIVSPIFIAFDTFMGLLVWGLVFSLFVALLVRAAYQVWSIAAQFWVKRLRSCLASAGGQASPNRKDERLSSDPVPPERVREPTRAAAVRAGDDDRFDPS